MLTKFNQFGNCEKVKWADDGIVLFGKKNRYGNYIISLIANENLNEYELVDEVSGIIRYDIDKWIVSFRNKSSSILNNNFEIIDIVPIDERLILNERKKTGYFLSTSQWIENSRKLSLYAIENLEKVWYSENEIMVFENEVFDYNKSKKSRIGKVDLTMQKLKWETDLTKLQYTGSFPTYLKSNVLFFMRDRFEYEDAMALNSDNGELLWKHDIPFKHYYKVDQTKDKLISLYDGYIERDIYTGQVTLEHRDEDTFKEFDPRSRGSNFCQVGKHLIAIVHNRNKIYVYNTESHKFDFIYTDPEVKSFVAGHHVVFHNEHLYLMDIEKNMHIYKKEGSWE